MKKKILCGAIAGAVSSMTFAQGVEPDRNITSALLEEVVVTATRRSESMQDVSLSVSAFSGDAISDLGTTSLEGLTDQVAGAELFDDRGAGQPTWVIRGVGLADFNANNTPTAAIYYDDYYLTSNVLGGIGLFDIDSVEVLKGPQGGLYGRNTTGGAVKVNSKAPLLGEENSGYIKTSYGRWGHATLEGATGGSLNDQLAYRVAAMTDQGGGWQDSLATEGDDDHGDRDFNAIRAQLLYAPSESVDIKLKMETGNNKSETALRNSRALFDSTSGDFCSAALAGNYDNKNCVTWYNFTNLVSRGSLGILPSEQSSDGSRVLSSPINKLDDEWKGLNLQLNMDLGYAELSSITGYLDYEQHQVHDFDGSPLALIDEESFVELTSWSQEFRLVSNGDERLSWILGALYASDTDEELRRVNLADQNLIFGDASAPDLGSISQRSFEQETTSWSVYGELGYELTDSVEIHGSIRYTDETKDYNDGNLFQVFGLFPAGFSLDDMDFNLSPDSLPADATVFFTDQTLDNLNLSTQLDSNWSGHIGIDWHVSNDMMVYARATRGFKSGGFFGGFAIDGAQALSPYGEETVNAYEVGLKSTLLDGSVRFNTAAYYYDYRDIQGFTQVYEPSLDVVLTKLGNIGRGEHKGLEVELLWAPTFAEGLTFQVAASWLDAEITDSDTNRIGQDGFVYPVEGLKRAFAPSLSYNTSLSYELPLFEGWFGGVQLNYSWRDDLSGSDNTLSVVDEAAFNHDSYGILNARFYMASEDDKWEIALSGKNLTDETYATRTGTDDLYSYSQFDGRPMSYSISGSYHW